MMSGGFHLKSAVKLSNQWGPPLVKRWDNVPHHKKIKTFPRHVHLPNNKVKSSPSVNIKKVLKEIENILPVGDNY